MLISAVVPVYNSEGSLPALIERLSSVLEPSQKLGELILVNDGSRDNSWEVIKQLAAAHSWVRGLNLMRNFGQHNALLCGIRAAQYDTIVTLDDDLQTPPEEIPRLLARLQEGCDVVYGTPERQSHGILRDLASTVTKVALQSTMGAKTARKVSSFRAFRAHLRDAFAMYAGPFVSIDVLLTWGTRNFDSVTVRNDPRTIGVSNYTVGKLFTHAMNMMTGFSTVPLQIASVIGFSFAVLGLAILAFVVVRYFLNGDAVPGFPFLASVIAIFSGAQLFALGIMGEYLARMHFRMMDRPSYSVLNTTAERASAAEPVLKWTIELVMPDKFNLEQIRAFWTEQARVHEQAPAASWSDFRVMEMETREIIKYLVDGDRVLDVGCANGLSTVQFASEKNVQIRGLDYIEDMILHAQRRLIAVSNGLRGSVEFARGDITSLEEPAGAYDKVVVIRVLINLGSWPRQLAALRECARVLKAGGTLLVSEATVQGWRSLNALRAEWGLTDIPMPAFNEYIDEETLRRDLPSELRLLQVVNFASSYYVGTRLLKPLLSKALGGALDPADPGAEWNRWCSQLPASGDYGTQKLFVFEKK